MSFLPVVSRVTISSSLFVQWDSWKHPKTFNNLILIEDDFRIVRFRDVGYAELDAANRQNILLRNGIPMVSVVIIPQPGANHISIADEVRVRMEQMQKDLPDDVVLDVAFDNTMFIRASISEVEKTVLVAFALVVLLFFSSATGGLRLSPQL